MTAQVPGSSKGHKLLLGRDPTLTKLFLISKDLPNPKLYNIIIFHGWLKGIFQNCPFIHHPLG